MIDDPLLQKSVEIVEALLRAGGTYHQFLVTSTDLTPPLSIPRGMVARVTVQIEEDVLGDSHVTFAGIREYA